MNCFMIHVTGLWIVNDILKSGAVNQPLPVCYQQRGGEHTVKSHDLSRRLRSCWLTYIPPFCKRIFTCPLLNGSTLREGSSYEINPSVPTWTFHQMNTLDYVGMFISPVLCFAHTTKCGAIKRQQSRQTKQMDCEWGALLTLVITWHSLDGYETKTQLGVASHLPSGYST